MSDDVCSLFASVTVCVWSRAHDCLHFRVQTRANTSPPTPLCRAIYQYTAPSIVSRKLAQLTVRSVSSPISPYALKHACNFLSTYCIDFIGHQLRFVNLCLLYIYPSNLIQISGTDEMQTLPFWTSVKCHLIPAKLQKKLDEILYSAIT